MPDVVKYKITKGNYTDIKNVYKDKEQGFIQAAKQNGITIERINDTPTPQSPAQPTNQKPVNNPVSSSIPTQKKDISDPFNRKSGTLVSDAINKNKQFSVAGAIQESKQRQEAKPKTKINPTIESNAKIREAGQQAPLPIDTRDNATQNRATQDIATLQAKQEREKQIGVTAPENYQKEDEQIAKENELQSRTNQNIGTVEANSIVNINSDRYNDVVLNDPTALQAKQELDSLTKERNNVTGLQKLILDKKVSDATDRFNKAKYEASNRYFDELTSKDPLSNTSGNGGKSGLPQQEPTMPQMNVDENGIIQPYGLSQDPTEADQKNKTIQSQRTYDKFEKQKKLTEDVQKLTDLNDQAQVIQDKITQGTATPLEKKSLENMRIEMTPPAMGMVNSLLNDVDYLHSNGLIGVGVANYTNNVILRQVAKLKDNNLGIGDALTNQDTWEDVLSGGWLGVVRNQVNSHMLQEIGKADEKTKEGLMSCMNLLVSSDANTVNSSFWYDAVGGVMSSMSYIGQMALTGGIADIANLATNQIVKRTAKNLFAKGMQRSAIRTTTNIIGRTIPKMIAFATVSPFAYKYAQEETIKRVGADYSLSDIQMTDVMKGYGKMAIEYVIEGSGEVMKAGIGKLVGAGDGMGARWFNYLKGKSSPEIKMIMKATKWDGLGYEYAEEVLQNIIDCSLWGEMSFKQLTDPYNNLVTLATCALIASPAAAVQGKNVARDLYKLNKDIGRVAAVDTKVADNLRNAMSHKDNQAARYEAVRNSGIFELGSVDSQRAALDYFIRSERNNWQNQINKEAAIDAYDRQLTTQVVGLTYKDKDGTNKINELTTRDGNQFFVMSKDISGTTIIVRPVIDGQVGKPQQEPATLLQDGQSVIKNVDEYIADKKREFLGQVETEEAISEHNNTPINERVIEETKQEYEGATKLATELNEKKQALDSADDQIRKGSIIKLTDDGEDNNANAKEYTVKEVVGDDATLHDEASNFDYKLHISPKMKLIQQTIDLDEADPEQEEINRAINGKPSIYSEEQEQANTPEQQKVNETKSTKVKAGNKQVVSVGNIAPIQQRFDKSKKLLGFEGSQFIANGEEIQGYFLLVEADGITASHDSQTFAQSDGFPTTETGTTINDRDYSQDKHAQAQVIDHANSYDGRAIQNLPIVTEDGIVISGNDRTMSSQLAAVNGTDGKYIDSLNKAVRMYGFTPEALQEFKHPRVVFLTTDPTIQYNTETFAKFNKDDKKSQSKTEKAVKASKTINEEVIVKIANVLDSYENLSDFYKDKKAVNKVVKILLNSHIIEPNEMAELMEGDLFSPIGKDRLETLIIGGSMNEESNRILPQIPSVRQNIVKAIMPIIANVKLGEYSIYEEINSAIKLIYEAKSAGLNISEYMAQTDAFRANPAEIYGEIEVLIAECLKGKQRDFKKMLSLLNQRSLDAANGEIDMFADRVETREEIINSILERYGRQQDTRTSTEDQRTNQGNEIEQRSLGDGTSSEAERASEEAGTEERGINQDQAQDDSNDRRENTNQVSSKRTTQEAIADVGFSKPQSTGSLFGESNQGSSDDKQASDISTGNVSARSEEVDKREITAESKGNSNNTDRTEAAKGNDTLGDANVGVSANTIVSEDRKDEILARLREKASNLNAGLDPESALLGMELTVYYVERGVRTFAAYVKAISKDLNEAKYNKYLKAFYNLVRDNPDYKEIASQMDSYAVVIGADVEEILKEENKEEVKQSKAEKLASLITPDNQLKPNQDVERSTESIQRNIGTISDKEQENTGNIPSEDSKSEQPNGSTLERSGSISTTRDAKQIGSRDNNGLPNTNVSKKLNTPISKEQPSLFEDNTNANNDRGSDNDINSGNSNGRTGDKATNRTSTNHLSKDELIALQKSIKSASVKIADEQSITETLPILQEKQRNDVLKAEQRFFDSDGKLNAGESGMMFTNGTGTGKTFTGIGIAKRFLLQGKNDIIIVVPSDKIKKDWIQTAAEYFEEDFTELENIKDAGKGVNITTYANFRKNEAIGDRKFNLIIYDECHYLNQNKSGNETSTQRKNNELALTVRGSLEKAQAELLPSYPTIKDKWGDLTDEQRLKFKEEEKAWDNAVLEKAKEIHQSRPRVLMLSATPFAYLKSLHYADGFIFTIKESFENLDYNRPSGYNQPDLEQGFMIQNFGYRMRYGLLTEPKSSTQQSNLERMFHEKLVKAGALSGRSIDVPYDYSRNFIIVKSGIGAKIDEGMSIIYKEKKYNALVQPMNKKWNYIKRAQFLEAVKSQGISEHIDDLMAQGRKVVVYHNFNKGNTENPLNFQQISEADEYDISEEELKRMEQLQKKFDNPDPNNEEALTDSEIEELENLMDAHSKYEAFQAAKDNLQRYNEQALLWEQEYPEYSNLDFGEIQSPLNFFTEKYGDKVVLFNGTISKKKRQGNVTKFNADDSNVNIILVQKQAGKEGISFHDTTGVHQRVLINLGLPTAPTDAIQIEGRIYRIGLQSDATFEYPIIDTSFERYAFGSTIASRSKTAENLALGNTARKLEQAFKEGYQNAVDVEAIDINELGKGTKELDNNDDNEISLYDRARALHTTVQKNSKSRQNREGKDYFATPEPIGFKMSEFLDTSEDEEVLEPSAGHGAIARFFPDDVITTVIEPSMQLASQLKINTNAKNVITTTFEDYNIWNKFDAIAMNPPFGVGGATAVQHVAKAFVHLRNNGRIVAIVPNGTSCDKHLDKFFNELGSDGKLVHPDAKLVAEIKLPSCAFENAGTGVSTKIIVIDKRKDNPYTEHIDLSYIEKTDQLFDALEDITVPGRADNNTPVTPNDKAKQLSSLLGNDNVFSIDDNEDIDTATASDIKTNPDLSKVKPDTNTLTGEDIFVVDINGRVDKDKYQELNQKAKDNHGYYSRFKKGFVFKNNADADAFISLDTNNNDIRFRSVEQAELQQAENEVNVNPSDAQKEAGNYKLGHVKLFGFDISIEQPKGSIRKGTDPDGRTWESYMNNTYGYIKGTKGKDGDHIDIYIGNDLNSEKVFIIDQLNKDKSFDEHKVMLGFNTQEEAKENYLANFEKGWKGLGNITEVHLDTFTKWVSNSTKKRKPFVDYAGIEEEAAKRQDMKLRAEQLATKLHSNIEFISLSEAPKEHKGHKAYFTPTTNKTTVIIDNHTSVEDIEKTILHECVAHEGLRAMFGNEFSNFLVNVYNAVTPKIKAIIDEKAKKDNLTTNVATEEYLAGLAEQGFDNRENANIWEKIKQFFKDMVSKAKLGMSYRVNDDDLSYILWRSYENKKASNGTIIDKINDISKRDKWDINSHTEYDSEIYALEDAIRAEYPYLTRKVVEETESALNQKTDKKSKKIIDRFFKSVLDAGLPLKQLCDKLKAQNGNLPFNVYTRHQTINSTVIATLEKFEATIGRRYMDVLKQIKHKTDITYEQIGIYHMAKYMPERTQYLLDRGVKDKYHDGLAGEKGLAEYMANYNTSLIEKWKKENKGKGTNGKDLDEYLLLNGFSRFTPEEYVSWFENRIKATTRKNKDGEQLLNDLNDKCRDIVNFTLDQAVKTGALSRVDYIDFKQSKNYVPLRGWRDEESSGEDNVFQWVNVQAKGRQSLADNPIPYMFAMAESTVKFGVKNDVKQDVATLLMLNEDKLYDAVGFTPLYTWDYTDDDGNFAGVRCESDVKEFYNDKNAVKESLEVISVYSKDKDKVKLQAAKKEYTEEFKQHLLTYTVDGQKKTIYVEDKGIVKAFDKKDLSNFSSLMGRMKGGIARYMTSRNPGFVFRNTIRDLGTVLFLNKYDHDLAFKSRVLFNMVKLTPTIASGVCANKWESDGRLRNMYNDWVLQGGRTGYAQHYKSIKQLEKEIKRMSYGKTKSYLWNAITLKWVEYGAEIFENITRFSVYATAVEKGYSKVDALQMSKECSVNFDKKGTDTTLISQYFAFFNPTVQGAYKIGQFAFGKETRVRALTTVGLLIFGGWLSSFLRDKYDDKADERSLYKKRRNILIGSFTIPVSFDLLPPFTLGNLIHELRNGKIGEKEFYYEAAMSLTGLIPEQGQNIINSMFYYNEKTGNIENWNPLMLVEALPTVFLPIGESMVNRNYMGGKIIPENKYQENTSRASLYNDSQVYEADKFVAKVINLIGNFDWKNYDENSSYINDKERWFDVSPADVRHFTSGYLAGLSQFWGSVSDVASLKDASTEEILSKAPITSSFYTKANPNIPVYDELNKMSAKYATIIKQADQARQNSKRIDNTPIQTERYEAQFDKIKENPLYQEAKQFEKLKKDFSKLNRNLNAADKTGNTSESERIKEELKELKLQISNNSNESDE